MSVRLFPRRIHMFIYATVKIAPTTAYHRFLSRTITIHFYCGKYNDAVPRLRLHASPINNLPASFCLPRFNQRTCVLMIMETISNNHRYVRLHATQAESQWREPLSVTSRDLVLSQRQMSMSHCRICRFLVDSVGSINS